jgi:YesN/AraC family two-component response regulator
MTVQQIASAVGYQDMKYFHSLFRQQTGATPQEYRKRDDGTGSGASFGE